MWVTALLVLTPTACTAMPQTLISVFLASLEDTCQAPLAPPASSLASPAATLIPLALLAPQVTSSTLPVAPASSSQPTLTPAIAGRTAEPAPPPALLLPAPTVWQDSSSPMDSVCSVLRHAVSAH